MFEYFYHEILKRTIISFGTLFNNIIINRTDESDNTVRTLKVPLAYAPIQKFLARLEQSPANLNKSYQITLPRMSFEFVGLTYDPTRKSTQTQTFLTTLNSDKTKDKKVYLPVPYNMSFELNIMTKLNDDMLQIIEQILPYFQPSYNLTVDLVEEIGEKRDVAVVLENITMSDDYEGNFETRRVLVYTLRFTVKTYLFGPVISASSDIVKKVSIGYVANGTGGRSVTYSAEPRAIESYSDNAITNLSDDIDASTKTINVNNANPVNADSYITVDDEEMYVESKSGNTLTVRRGEDGTKASKHVRGSEVKGILVQDNYLIEFGDDFGFSGSYS